MSEDYKFTSSSPETSDQQRQDGGTLADRGSSRPGEQAASGTEPRPEHRKRSALVSFFSTLRTPRQQGFRHNLLSDVLTSPRIYSLRCDKLQSMNDRLIAELTEYRDRSVDNSYALVRRPESSATLTESTTETAALATTTKKHLEDVAQIFFQHDGRLNKLEYSVNTGPNKTAGAQSSTLDLERRLARLEERADGDSGSGSGREAIKQDKKGTRTMVRIFLLPSNHSTAADCLYRSKFASSCSASRPRRSMSGKSI